MEHVSVRIHVNKASMEAYPCHTGIEACGPCVCASVCIWGSGIDVGLSERPWVVKLSVSQRRKGMQTCATRKQTWSGSVAGHCSVMLHGSLILGHVSARQAWYRLCTTKKGGKKDKKMAIFFIFLAFLSSFFLLYFFISIFLWP